MSAIVQEAQKKSDFVPLELVAVDEDAVESHAPDLPFCFQGQTFCLALPSASGPRTLGNLLQVQLHTCMLCIAIVLDFI